MKDKLTEYNEVDVFLVNNQFKLHIDLNENHAFPLKIWFFTKEMKDQLTFEKIIPEDLRIYFS